MEMDETAHEHLRVVQTTTNVASKFIKSYFMWLIFY